MLPVPVGFAPPAMLTAVLRTASLAEGALSNPAAIHDVGGDEELAIADILHPLAGRNHLVWDLNKENHVAISTFVGVQRSV